MKKAFCKIRILMAAILALGMAAGLAIPVYATQTDTLAIRTDAARVSGRTVTLSATITAYGLSDYRPSRIFFYLRCANNTWQERIYLPSRHNYYRRGTQYSTTAVVPFDGEFIYRAFVVNDWQPNGRPAANYGRITVRTAPQVAAPVINAASASPNQGTTESYFSFTVTTNSSVTSLRFYEGRGTRGWMFGSMTVPSSENANRRTWETQGFQLPVDIGAVTVVASNGTQAIERQIALTVNPVTTPTPTPPTPTPPTPTPQPVVPVIVSFDTDSSSYTVGDTVTFRGVGLYYSSWKIEWLRGNTVETTTGIQHGANIQFNATVNSVIFNGARLTLFELPQGQGGRVTSTVNFEVTGAPQVNITAPANNATIRTDDIFQFTGTYDDAEHLIVRLGNIVFDSRPGGSGTVYVTLGTGSNANRFTANLPTASLNPGQHTVSVEAVNRHGRSTTATRIIIIEAATARGSFNCTTPTPGFAFFLQTDFRWANYSYGAHTGASTFGRASCGLFAVKNSLLGLGIKISVNDLHTIAVESRARVDNNGSSAGTIASHIQDRGIASITVTRNIREVQRVRDHVRGGGVAVVNTPNHFMAIVEYCQSTSRFLVQDSAPTGATGRGRSGDRNGTWINPNVWTSMGPEWYTLISSSANTRTMEQRFEEVVTPQPSPQPTPTPRPERPRPPVGAGTVLTVQGAEGRIGDRVTVEIISNTGTTNGNFALQFDESRLRFISASAGNSLSSSLISNHVGNLVRIAWAQATEGNPGIIATIEFQILPNATGNIPLSLGDVVLSGRNAPSLEAGYIRVITPVLEIPAQPQPPMIYAPDLYTPDILPPVVNDPVVVPAVPDILVVYTLGDISGDGLINSDDAHLLLSYLSNSIQFDERQRRAASIVAGTPNPAGVTAILRYTVGLPSALSNR